MSITLVYYFGLALLSVTQGPIAILLGAGAAATGVITPVGVFIAVTIGNLSVDMIWFMIGRLGKISWVLKIRFLRLNLETIDRLKQALFQKAPKIVALAKLSSVFVLPVMIAAGLVRLPWKRWFPTLFGVEIVKNIVLILAGYYSVVSITQLQKGFAILAITGSILSVVIPWWLFRRSSHIDGSALAKIMTEEPQENKA